MPVMLSAAMFYPMQLQSWKQRALGVSCCRHRRIEGCSRDCKPWPLTCRQANVEVGAGAV